MSLLKELEKISPDVADLYEEIYINTILELSSLSLHDLSVDLGICPYHGDSLDTLQIEFTKLVISKMCNDKRFLDMSVKKAYVHDNDSVIEYYYIVGDSLCFDCGKRHALAIVDTGKNFRIDIVGKFPSGLKTTLAPSTVGDVIRKYL